MASSHQSTRRVNGQEKKLICLTMVIPTTNTNADTTFLCSSFFILYFDCVRNEIILVEVVVGGGIVGK